MKKKDTTSDEGSGWDSAPAGRITPQDVQQKEFRVARFGAGYRMREVDEFLDRVTDAMSALVAESERLRRGSADPGSASGRPSAPTSADDAGRAAVDAFLRREKGFLQDLGGLIQTHAEELRSMVREVRRDVPAPAADTSPVEGPAVEPTPTPVSSPDASPGPSPDESTELDAPPEEIAPGPELGATEQATSASEVPDHDAKGDLPEASGGHPIATTEAAAEEPIRVDEPEPARSRRSEEEEDGSLRELFWGEE